MNNDNPFDTYVMKPEPGRGLIKKTPILIPSMSDSRMVGCCCEDDYQEIVWFELTKGKEPKQCDCGNYFKLIDYDPLDPNIKPKYGMGFGSGLGSLYYFLLDILFVLKSVVQQSISKAVAYYLELEALTARLYIKKKEGEKLSREASTARLEEDKVREEIATTKENYESQLSVMSDHLASMNSKLAEQEDLILQLKFEQKGGKKGKK